MKTFIFLVLGICVVLFILYLLLPSVQVIGSSMFPTYKDGEFLWASRVFSRKKLRVGDVMIFYAPYDMGECKILIKRIYDIKYNAKGNKPIEIFFVGDNLDGSYDSRNYGYVPTKFLIGKIIQQRPKEELKCM